MFKKFTYLAGYLLSKDKGSCGLKQMLWSKSCKGAVAVVSFKNGTFLQTVFTHGLHLIEQVKRFPLKNVIGNLIWRTSTLTFNIISENPITRLWLRD